MGTCKAKLKTGKRAGQRCGAKTKEDDDYCTRHQSYEPDPDDFEDEEEEEEEDELLLREEEGENSEDEDSLEEIDEENSSSEDDSDDEENSGSEDSDDGVLFSVKQVVDPVTGQTTFVTDITPSVTPISSVGSISTTHSSPITSVQLSSLSPPSIGSIQIPVPLQAPSLARPIQTTVPLQPIAPQIQPVMTIENMMGNLHIDNANVIETEDDRVKNLLKFGKYSLEELIVKRPDETTTEFALRSEFMKRVGALGYAGKDALLISYFLTKKALSGVNFGPNAEAIIKAVLERL